MPKGRSYTGGSIVYFQNDVGNDIYVLQKGRVILLSTAIDTGEELKEEVKGGEFFGVKSALAGHPREETAQVLGATQVIVFSNSEFEAYVLKNTRLIMTMARVFSKQLRHIHKQVRDILHADAIINPAFELLGVAESFFKVGQLEHAVYSFQRYIEFNPSGNNIKRAQELLQMARKGLTFPLGYPQPVKEAAIDNFDMDVQLGMVDASTALNDPTSMENIKSESKSNAESIQHIFDKGKQSFGNNQFEAALKDFEACTKLSHLRNEHESQLFSQSHYELGATQIKLQQYEEAQQTLSNYIKEFPTDSFIKKALYQMGLTAEALSNPDRARSLYTKVTQMPPPDDTTREARTRLEALG